MTVAVVVPCFDEADRFDASAFAGLAGSVGRLIFVDDGSRDATADLLDGLAATTANGNVEVVRLGRNRGKAEAVRAGMQHAIAGGADVTGYFDADLATPPSELLRMLAVLDADQGLDAILASRVALLGHSIERRTTRHYLGRLYATFASATLRVPVYDTQCGAKLFRVTPALDAALAERFPDRWAFDVELLARLLYPRQGVAGVPADRIRELPLQAWRDVGGSKVGATSGVKALLALLAVRRGIRRRQR